MTSALPRSTITCNLRLSFLLAMVYILFFCSTVPESGNFVSRSGQKVGAFRPEGRIVYYAPREEKTLQLYFTPILLPWSVHYFSRYPGRKYHIPVSEQGGNVALSARVWRKNNYFVMYKRLTRSRIRVELASPTFLWLGII